MLIAPLEPSVAGLVIRKRPSTGEMSYRLPDVPRAGFSHRTVSLRRPRLRLGDSFTEAAIMPPLRST